MGTTCRTNGVEEECIQDIGGRTRRKKPLRRPRRRWVKILKWILEMMGWYGLD
jgi:hypothetical protein